MGSIHSSCSDADRGEHPFWLVRHQRGKDRNHTSRWGEHRIRRREHRIAQSRAVGTRIEATGQETVEGAPPPKKPAGGGGGDPHLAEEVEAVQAPAIPGAAIVLDVDIDGTVGEVVGVGDGEDAALVLDGVEVLGPGDGEGSTAAKEAGEGSGTRTLPRKLRPCRLQPARSRDHCRHRRRWRGRGRSSRSTTGRRGARSRWVELKLDLDEC
jgi:hypothetical protein